jgi:hypothetical protein
MDASLQLEPVILKDFVEYYASSRYGRISELLTVHSIATVWYRFVGYQNRITGSKLDRQLVNDVAAVRSQSSLCLVKLHLTYATVYWSFFTAETSFEHEETGQILSDFQRSNKIDDTSLVLSRS